MSVLCGYGYLSTGTGIKGDCAIVLSVLRNGSISLREILQSSVKC